MASSSSSRGLALLHEHVAEALLKSEDNGETLDLSHMSLAEIGDDGALALARVGAADDEDEGSVKRVALGYNHLHTLPATLNLMCRLRYLNLRGNSFSVFPDVLTTMPALEILDISRNKIKRLPSQPGNLIHLRVLCMSKNRLQRLPQYLVYFSGLKVLKVDHNPIEWPPREIIGRLQTEEEMESWITEVKMWIEENGPDEAERVPLARTRTENRIENGLELHSTLDQLDVDYSIDSQGLLFSPPAPHARNISDDSTLSFSTYAGRSTPLRPPPLRLPGLASSSPSSPYPSPDLSSATPDGLGFGEVASPHGSLLHGRGASESVSRRNKPQALGAKKSLPDLRSTAYPPSPRMERAVQHSTRSRSRGTPSEHPALPTTSNLKVSSPLLPRDPGAAPPPLPGSSANPPAMDAERNSYFRRLSTLPPSTISRTVPDALLKVVDAVRGILFAVSQVYSSLRHYTVYAIDDRLAGLLNRVLDPASTYMGQLINALDRFDSFSRRGLPASIVCLEVFKSCQDNVAVFGKLLGALQAQLKVLAGADDVRYTRTLLLMLYGSMAEVSNSWVAMGPHLSEIQPLLRDGRMPLSKLRPAGVSVGTPITPIVEQQESASRAGTPQADRSGASASQVAAHSTSARRSRRHAGSFSVKDVEVGKSLPSSTTPDMPETPSLPAAIPQAPPLRSALRNPLPSSAGGSASGVSPLLSSVSPPQSAQSSTSYHNRDDSQPLPNNHFITPPATAPRPPRPILTPSSSASSFPSHPSPSPMPRSPAPVPTDSSQIFDGDLLTMMDTVVNTATTVWSMLAELLDSLPDQHVELRNALTKAEQATERMQSDLGSVSHGAAASHRKAMWDAANQFVKTVVQVSTLTRTFSAENPLPSNLRTNLGRLTQTTKDFAVFLHVSSLAPAARTPGQRAFSPAFEESPRVGNGVMSPGPSSRGATPMLLRSRSDAATPSRSTQGIPKDVPWSAQPQQSFRIHPVPPRQAESATRPSFDSPS